MATTTTTQTTTTTAPGRGGGNVPPLAQGGGGGGSPPAAGGGGPPGGPPPPVVFARTPGELEANDLINYATREGRATFRHAIAEFPGDFKFDGNSANINAFHERLMQRAEEFGWNQGAGNIVLSMGSIPLNTMVDLPLSSLGTPRLLTWTMLPDKHKITIKCTV